MEVVLGGQTAPQTLKAAKSFAESIKKVAIIANNRPGFSANHILYPTIHEAIFAVQEGLATAEDIDTSMKLGCSHPIGSFALADLVGLDTSLAVITSFYTGYADPKCRLGPMSKEMVLAGK